MLANQIGLRMYEQQVKPQKKTQEGNRQDARFEVTNKASNRPKLGDSFFDCSANGVQKQNKTRLNAYSLGYFLPQSSTVQRMAASLPTAQMLAMLSRLIAGLAGGVALTKSLEELNRSPEFEQMTATQKMTVYAVLYKIADKPKSNTRVALPAQHDSNASTGGSEMVEKGLTSRSLPMTDQAILDLLGPIPIPTTDDMVLDSSTSSPIVDDLELGLVYSQKHGDATATTGQENVVEGVVKASETIGRPVEAVIGNKKRLLRVDIEPNGKLQIQSGGGKNSIVDFRPDLSKPLAPQINKAFRRLPQASRDQLIKNAEKGLKRLQDTGNI